MDRAELERILRNGSRPPELEEAVERLRAERWPLYMRLGAPYFSPRPRPNLIGIWRAEASESVARRLALADHDEALDFILAHLNGAEGS
jgi:hypothetical protein